MIFSHWHSHTTPRNTYVVKWIFAFELKLSTLNCVLAVGRQDIPPIRRLCDPKNVHVTVATAMTPKVNVSFSFRQCVDRPTHPILPRTLAYLHIDLSRYICTQSESRMDELTDNHNQ